VNLALRSSKASSDPTSGANFLLENLHVPIMRRGDVTGSMGLFQKTQSTAGPFLLRRLACLAHGPIYEGFCTQWISLDLMTDGLVFSIDSPIVIGFVVTNPMLGPVYKTANC
jgi:hypothetical protein